MNICDNLPLYLYSEMNKEDEKTFEKHLENCVECQNTVKVFRALQQSKTLCSAPVSVVNSIFDKTSRKKNIFIGWKDS